MPEDALFRVRLWFEKPGIFLVVSITDGGTAKQHVTKAWDVKFHGGRVTELYELVLSGTNKELSKPIAAIMEKRFTAFIEEVKKLEQ